MLRKFGNSAIDVDDVISVRIGGGGATASIYMKSLGASPGHAYVQWPNEDAKALIDWIEAQAQEDDARTEKHGKPNR